MKLLSVLCGTTILALCSIHGTDAWFWGSSSSSRTSASSSGSSSPSTNVDCYGDIDVLSPTGKGRGGVSASQKEVRARLTLLNGIKSCSETIARDNCIPASVIGAIASRESNGGASLDSRGYGDNGNGYGIMQCDVNTSGLRCTSCEPRSCCHITMMVKQKLIPDINAVARKHPSWSKARQLQGAVAAYNFGVSNVQSWGGLDRGSTGNDYSNDVIARAQYLRTQGWS